MPASLVLQQLLASPPPRKTSVVFDIDNTVADTRYRTLAVARAFDELCQSAHFRGLTLDCIGLDGETTARRLGTTPEVAEAFQAFWQSNEGFWNGSRFACDRVLEPVATLAQLAQLNGFDVVWLTGRIQALHAPTLQWFREHDLPEGTLVCKPGLSVRTTPFKVEYLANCSATGSVAFFMTESTGDIAAVQATLPAIRCVLVDFPDPEPIPIRPDTLRLRLDPPRH